MSGFLERTKLFADIAKIGSEIYGLVIDKSRAQRDRDARIKELEKQLAELQAKVK